MIDYKALRKEIEIDEGRRDKVHTCSMGKLTIGVGHNIEDNPLPDEVIDLLFNMDIEQTVIECERFDWYKTLSPLRQRVIVNMAFNMGVSGVLKFKKMIAAIEIGDFDEAATQMMHSKWYRQVGDRAERLCQMMETGVAE